MAEFPTVKHYQSIHTYRHGAVQRSVKLSSAVRYGSVPVGTDLVAYVDTHLDQV